MLASGSPGEARVAVVTRELLVMVPDPLRLAIYRYMKVPFGGACCMIGVQLHGHVPNCLQGLVLRVQL